MIYIWIQDKLTWLLLHNTRLCSLWIMISNIFFLLKTVGNKFFFDRNANVFKWTFYCYKNNMIFFFWNVQFYMTCQCSVYVMKFILQVVFSKMINSRKSSHERKIIKLIWLTAMIHFRNLFWFGYHLKNWNWNTVQKFRLKWI